MLFIDIGVTPIQCCHVATNDPRCHVATKFEEVVLLPSQSRIYRKLMEGLGVNASIDAKINKEKRTYQNIMWFLNKTAQMFEYHNLPPTIPAIALERILQFTGAAVIARVDETPIGYGPSFNYFGDDSTVLSRGNLFAFTFSFADAPDPYGEPYQVIITNPGFRPTISKTLTLNEEAIIIRNDSYMQGLYRLHKKYAALMTEAEISLQSTIVLLRDQMTFVVKTASQRAEVNKYIEARENGEYASILSHDMGNPMDIIAHDGRSNAVELAVNGVQAIKAAWYNEIGLNPSFSLKREYTSAQEIDTNTDLLLPIIDDMYENRRIAVESINKLFGTSITVQKSSAWKVKEEQTSLALEVERAEVDNLASDDGNVDDGESLPRGNKSSDASESDRNE